MFRFLQLEPGGRLRWAPLDAYIQMLAPLYRGVRDVTETRLIVDSSKRAGRSFGGLIDGTDRHISDTYDPPPDASGVTAEEVAKTCLCT